MRSSAKMERDAEARRARIAVGVPALDAINERLASPRLRLESNVAIAQEADEALKECGATRWVSYEIGEITEVRHHYEARGRPGKNTRYRRVEKVPQRLHFSVCVCVCARNSSPTTRSIARLLAARDQRVRPLDAGELLVAYKYQCHLERRHLLKATTSSSHRYPCCRTRLASKAA